MTDTVAPAPKRRRSPAAWFLLIIAALIVLAVLGLVGYKMFEPQLWRWAYVPGQAFDGATVPKPDYAGPAAWVARPGAEGPANQAPPEFRAAPKPAVDVFYIHPTTFLDKSRWNGPVDDPVSAGRVTEMVRHHASAFNGVGAVWAPKYRQATFGAFLVPGPASIAALQLAYTDVLAAFDAFVAQRDASRPFILAGHSQGSLHALRLLKDRVAGTPLAAKLVAAYIIGWPVSQGDLAALPGLPACQTPAAGGCIISWQTFGMGADTSGMAGLQALVPTLSGTPRGAGTTICTNPLTFWQGGKPAGAETNIGALPYATADQPLGALMPELTGASCDRAGFLILDREMKKPFTSLVMPGQNFHVYDYQLFWANIRANAETRTEAFLQPMAAAAAR
jgi:hypothetical protein